MSLDRALALEKKHDGALRIFPMDLRLDETGMTMMGTSRSVAVAGIAKSLEEAHDISVQGAKALGASSATGRTWAARRHREEQGAPAALRKAGRDRKGL